MILTCTQLMCFIFLQLVCGEMQTVESYDCNTTHEENKKNILTDNDKVNNEGKAISGQHFNLIKGPLTIETLDAVNASTLKLGFEIPEMFVDPLDWRVEVYYINNNANRSIVNPTHCSLQIFAIPSELKTSSSQMEVSLTELQPDTEYRISALLEAWGDVLHEYRSKWRTIRTPKEKTTKKMISPYLYVSKINTTWAQIKWRTFTTDEQALIDGIKFTYLEKDDDGYDMNIETSLIHRSITDYTFSNLKPNSKYNVRMWFIPINGQTYSLYTIEFLSFTTETESNPYDFRISLEVDEVNSNTALLYWSSFPRKSNEYIHIYRLVYQNVTGNYSVFGDVDRDTSSNLRITNLNCDTQYIVWMEMYLKNGETRRSNNCEFTCMSTFTDVSEEIPRNTTYGTPIITTTSQHLNWRIILLVISSVAAIIVVGIYAFIYVLLKRHYKSKDLIGKVLEKQTNCTINYK